MRKGSNRLTTTVAQAATCPHLHEKVSPLQLRPERTCDHLLNDLFPSFDPLDIYDSVHRISLHARCHFPQPVSRQDAAPHLRRRNSSLRHISRLRDRAHV